MDALHGEIERLRHKKESDGKLSLRDERKLKGYKKLLGERLGAAVIYPEDRQPVPVRRHQLVAFGMKHIDRMLKGNDAVHPDGRLYHLMHAIFDFKVDASTVKRYYYMSEDAEEFGK